MLLDSDSYNTCLAVESRRSQKNFCNFFQFNTSPNRFIDHYIHEKNALCSIAAPSEIAFIEEHHLTDDAAELNEYALGRLKGLTEKHRLIGMSPVWGCISESILLLIAQQN